jgi:hypothetical protein
MGRTVAGRSFCVSAPDLVVRLPAMSFGSDDDL